MSQSCFLFGHADTPESVLPFLAEAIEEKVMEGVRSFYVGYHGSFDRLAASALRKIKREHNEISVSLVLPYHPAEQTVELPFGFDGSFYPPLENVPRRFALVRANRYMVQTCDIIICYVNHFGNARNLLEYAQKQKNVSIMNLASERV